MIRTKEYYLNLPWTIQTTPDCFGFFVQVKELTGCISHGATVEEAYSMIKEALDGYIEISLKHNDFIPVPESVQTDLSDMIRNYLSSYRQKNHLTKKQIAEKIGVNGRYLSRFEKGLINPSLDFVNKALQAVNAKVRIE